MAGIFDLALLLLGAKVGGALFNRFGQPGLVGELLAGVILGISFFNLVQPSAVVSAASQLGLLFLVLLVTLAVDWKKIESKTEKFSIIEFMRAIMIFSILFLAGDWFGWDFYTRVIVAVALIPSSLAIASRTLTSIGEHNSKEGETIIGLQVIDDVAAVLSIAILANFLETATFGIEPIAKLLFIVVGFFVVMRKTASRFIGWLIDFMQRHGMEEALLGIALVVAFALGTFTEGLGLASFLGFFLAGLMLSKTSQAVKIQQKVREIGEAFFIPIFFASIGVTVNVFTAAGQLDLALMLVALIMVVRLVASTLPLLLFKYEPYAALKIGSGMLPLAEVSLIILGIGPTARVLNESVFSIMIIVFLAVNILAPFAMGLIFKRKSYAIPRRSFLDKYKFASQKKSFRSYRPVKLIIQN